MLGHDGVDSEEKEVSETVFRRVMAVRTGGGTERCHGIRHQGSYSVAHHTWGVLALLFILFPEDYPRLSPAILFHDVPEGWVGDIPAPTKAYDPSVKAACDRMERQIFARLDLPHDLDLPDEDRRKIKACDHLDLYFWAREQQAAGNQHAACVQRELESFFEQRPLLPPAHSLYLEARGRECVHDTDGLIQELCR